MIMLSNIFFIFKRITDILLLLAPTAVRNTKEIFSETDVDGGLVGGSSLIADEFAEIIKALK